jgi:hypothetical protein
MCTCKYNHTILQKGLRTAECACVTCIHSYTHTQEHASSATSPDSLEASATQSVPVATTTEEVDASVPTVDATAQAVDATAQVVDATAQTVDATAQVVDTTAQQVDATAQTVDATAQSNGPSAPLEQEQEQVAAAVEAKSPPEEEQASGAEASNPPPQQGAQAAGASAVSPEQEHKAPVVQQQQEPAQKPVDVELVKASKAAPRLVPIDIQLPEGQTVEDLGVQELRATVQEQANDVAKAEEQARIAREEQEKLAREEVERKEKEAEEAKRLEEQKVCMYMRVCISV